jgi:hypothetical protein
MSKSKTEANRKRQKAQEAAPKAERCKWDPSFCPKVEALGAEGKSAPEIRRALGISPSAWRNWVRKHADFADAVEQAADLAEACWIDLGRKGVLLGTNFSAQTFIYLTKNIFPARFRDRQDHQITGRTTARSCKSCAPLTSPASPTRVKHCGSSSSFAPASLSPRRRALPRSTDRGMAPELRW